jgi:hypothetical protein
MRRRFDRTLRLLIVLNLVVIGLLAATMVANWLSIIPSRGTGSGDGGDGGAASGSPGASVPLMQMGLAHIPTSNDCLLCHDSGGSSGVKVIPAIGHPLAGWTACLTCHTNEKLGRDAPGHEGIAESECINCHKVAQLGPAITQAHANLNQPCLDCHGSVAHLPSSMVGRNQDDCWLCHKPNPSPPPIKPHPDPANLSCRSCHQAANAGALPIDHALRGDDTCVLCHDIRAGASASPGSRASAVPTLAPTPAVSPVPTASPIPIPTPGPTG